MPRQTDIPRGVQEDLRDTVIELHRILQRMDERLIVSTLPGLSPKLRFVLRFIEENFCEGVGVKQAASYVKMHPASLWKRIRKELTQTGTNITFSEYINSLRVRRAKELLRSDPFLECKEVASMVGTGVRNLEMVFKRYVGKTLSEYRQAILGT